MNIFVAKLDYSTDSDTLQRVFEQYGEVTSCKIIFDKFSNRSKGFGFVEMDNQDEAMSAIEALNDSELDGRNIVVKVAEDRPSRSNNNRNSRNSFNKNNNYNRNNRW